MFWNAESMSQTKSITCCGCWSPTPAEALLEMLNEDDKTRLSGIAENGFLHPGKHWNEVLAKITNHSTGICYKNYVLRVVFLLIFFQICEWYFKGFICNIFPWDYDIMNKYHKIMNGNILHKCLTIECEKWLSLRLKIHCYILIHFKTFPST